MPDQNRSATELVLDCPLQRLVFSTYNWTGTDNLTRPGVGYTLYFDRSPKDLMEIVSVDAEGKERYLIPGNVLNRNQVRKLRNLLTDFLLDFPEEEPGEPGST